MQLKPTKEVKTKHIHKLKRIKYKTGNLMYFCIDNCNFKISPALSLGKEVRCNRCDESFTMNAYSLRLALPHCPACHSSKDTKISTEQFLSSDKTIDEIIEDQVTEGTKYTSSNLSDRLRNIVNNAKHEDEDEDEI